ncbi:MAG: hypothetical protein HY326_00560 [Chloroflexi bacterium]|nr:hypothetical protein [Chloroflexota bacterium]
MEALLRRQDIRGLAFAFVVGAAFGLVVLGWWIFPVQWENATAADLSPQAQREYVSAVAESYMANQDTARALARLSSLDPKQTGQLLQNLAVERESSGLPQDAQQFRRLATAVASAPPLPGQAAGNGGGLPGSLITLLVLAVLAVIIVGIGTRGQKLLSAGSLPFGKGRSLATPASLSDLEGEDLDAPSPTSTLRERLSAPTRSLPGTITSEGAGFAATELFRGPQAAPRDAAPTKRGAPPATQTFIAQFDLGMDNYKESFVIDDARGEPVIECGVSRAAIVGDVPPDHPTAMKLWLYEKDDVRTTSMMILSEYAYYQDQNLRSQLTSRGDAKLAEPNKLMILETKSYRLQATILDMAYGQDESVAPHSFFERLVIELRPIAKASGH